MYIEKVVGSTFALGSNPITLESFESLAGHEQIVENTQGIRCKIAPCWIVPEPNNRHDELALAVYTQYVHRQNIRIGYISKKSQLREWYINYLKNKQLQVNNQTFYDIIQQYYNCYLLIEAYHEKDRQLSDSYSIIMEPKTPSSKTTMSTKVNIN